MPARLLVACLIGALLSAAAPARAQDGVNVDPDSPAGKEYAIPLESVRRGTSADGDVAGARVRPGERTAPLFGAGVGETGGDGSNRPGEASGGRTPRKPSAPEASAGAGAARRAAARAIRGEADGGGIGLVTGLLGGAAALVGLGTAAGLLLRRRRET